eukprot:11746796-Alexandrium_andersonii.AAC.1
MRLPGAASRSSLPRTLRALLLPLRVANPGQHARTALKRFSLMDGSPMPRCAGTLRTSAGLSPLMAS